MLVSMLSSVKFMGNNTCLNTSASKMLLFCEWLKGTGNRLYPGSAGPLTQVSSECPLSYNHMMRPISNIWLILVSLLIRITLESSICVCRKYERKFALKSCPSSALLLPGNTSRSQLLTPVCPFLPLILSTLSRSAVYEVLQLSTSIFRGLWVTWGVGRVFEIH